MMQRSVNLWDCHSSAGVKIVLGAKLSVGNLAFPSQQWSILAKLAPHANSVSALAAIKLDNLTSVVVTAGSDGQLHASVIGTEGAGTSDQAGFPSHSFAAVG